MKRIAMLLLTVLLLCSCSMNLDAGSLLEPPRLTAQQSAVYDALETAVGTSGFKLKYPQSGRNLSACTLYDLDGDGLEEAVAFYELTSGGTTATWISVLVQENGAWRSVKQIPGEGTDVERLEFADIIEGKKSIAVGWTSAGDDESTCYFYDYSEGKLDKFKTGFSYSDMLISDVDGDGFDDAVICSGGSISVLQNVDGRIVRTGSANVPGRTAGYAQIAAGELSEGVRAVFADILLAENKMRTSIILVTENAGHASLETLDAEEIGIFDSVTRPAGQALCADVNGDGYIDIPVCTPLPGYEESEDDDDIVWLTSYMTAVDSRLDTVERVIVNSGAGWKFTFPEEWDEFVTVRRLSDGGEWRFILYSGDIADASAAELMRIRTLSPADYQDKFETASYETAATKGIYEYQISVNDDAPAQYAITREQALDSFSLIS